VRVEARAAVPAAAEARAEAGAVVRAVAEARVEAGAVREAVAAPGSGTQPESTSLCGRLIPSHQYSFVQVVLAR
jgi:hypothetical protein